ncbi:hypothetical protein LSUE1_G001022 [Lachnellula suecica]|uniref:Protein AAR2-like protein n=1 Tax=Lachnellula suecica TaxID=602035 RepID=A0A8T9CH47_9HELO|nr:hypothetical protein LSUE1_G001022 [Lachnellula suecica]
MESTTPTQTTPERSSLRSDNSSPLLTDAGFNATPLVTAPISPPSSSNTTFITRSLSIQRNPSVAKEQAASLNRTLSVTSSASADSGHKSPVPNRLAALHPELQDRGRPGIHPTSGLTKSPSNASVRSVPAVGYFPIGSLQVHSPSPTRPDGEMECLKSGDVFIVRGIPKGSVLGYDNHVLTIGKEGQFEGIKDIPGGMHLVWGGSGIATLRNGFWFMSSKRASDEYGEIHVRRWDMQNEVLSEEVSQAEVRIQKGELPELLPKMQSYAAPVNSGNTSAVAKDPEIWPQLTSCMKGKLLTKITGQEWNHWQVSSFHDYSSQPKGPNLRREADITIGNYKDDVLKFMFPKSSRTFTDESRGRTRTEQALDSTSYVEDIISDKCSFQDSDEIIGEIQFCYLTGMLLGNVACMEHWAHVVKTVFHAYRLAITSPVFFTKFIQAVHTQFRYDQDYVEGSILEHDTHLADDLKNALITFKSRLNEQVMAQGPHLTRDQTLLANAFDEFEEWLWKWEWDLRGSYVRSGRIQLEDGEWVDAELKEFQAEDERGEWAPQVIELDEDGREQGLIRF